MQVSVGLAYLELEIKLTITSNPEKSPLGLGF